MVLSAALSWPLVETIMATPLSWNLNLEVQQKTRRSALDIVSYYYFFNPVQRLLTQLELQYRNNGLANYVARVLNVRSYNRILQWKRRALGVKGKLHTFDVFNCKS